MSSEKINIALGVDELKVLISLCLLGVRRYAVTSNKVSKKYVRTAVEITEMLREKRDLASKAGAEQTQKKYKVDNVKEMRGRR